MKLREDNTFTGNGEGMSRVDGYVLVRGWVCPGDGMGMSGVRMSGGGVCIPGPMEYHTLGHGTWDTPRTDS